MSGVSETHHGVTLDVTNGCAGNCRHDKCNVARLKPARPFFDDGGGQLELSRRQQVPVIVALARFPLPPVSQLRCC
jgi:hypothetical protein